MAADVDDAIADTPTCVAGGGSTVTHSSCSQGGSACAIAGCSGYNVSNPATWCPTIPECQFNHIMWYTTKSYSSSVDTGDAFMFSDLSSRILNYSPFVR